ncbi:hypothetical protein ACIQVO_15415 [Streptomyces sp. NPDC101062]|uniref:hypothetical protein n=1 Tax=unclassified Streptomyces TaxID=2593676 RepID=UPI003822A25E
MASGGRRGSGAGGRHAPARIRPVRAPAPAPPIALAALIAALALTGCAAGGNSSATSAPSARNTPSPHRTTPAELCATLVSYWAKEELNGGEWAGLDWEQKGLSNEQYVIHDAVVAAARRELALHGAAAALALVDRTAKRECAARDGATGSTENWREPP